MDAFVVCSEVGENELTTLEGKSAGQRIDHSLFTAVLLYYLDAVTFIPSHDGRIVAIGDLHGDLTKAIRALELAGVLEMQGEEIAAAKWVGGNTLVVQMGDLCDRGPAELQTMLLLRWLAAQARLSGGDVITLNGNHDIMQVRDC